MMIDKLRLSRKLGIALKLRDPPNLPAYGWSYFDHLVAVYVTLDKGDPRADDVIRKSRERPDDLNWGDIFRLENLVFSLQPPEVVKRSAWIIRERFHELECKSFYEKYVGSDIPAGGDSKEQQALLRADLTKLLDLLHWSYALIQIRERIRRSLTIRCLLMVLGYTFLLALTLVWCHFHNGLRGNQTFGDKSYLAILCTVIYCGIIGGFVSSQRRMQNIRTDGDPLLSVFGLDNAGYFLWLSPMLGAIFALVLTVMFVGGFLKGSVFPDFYSPKLNEGITFFDFVWYTLPKSGEDYGKLFVWAFLAGFAERLVPDSLDRLGSKLVPPPTPLPIVSIDRGGPGDQEKDGTDIANPNTVMPSEQPRITPEVLDDVAHSGEVELSSDEERKQQADKNLG
jgi:hypothetical protein